MAARKRSGRDEKSKERHLLGARYTDAEVKQIRDDIQEMVSSGGIEVSPNAYIKHASLTHARLRKLEAAIRERARGTDITGSDLRFILESMR